VSGRRATPGRAGAAEGRAACPNGEGLLRAETAGLIQLPTGLAGVGLALVSGTGGGGYGAPAPPRSRYRFLAARLARSPACRARPVELAVASNWTGLALCYTPPVSTDDDAASGVAGLSTTAGPARLAAPETDLPGVDEVADRVGIGTARRQMAARLVVPSASNASRGLIRATAVRIGIGTAEASKTGVAAGFRAAGLIVVPAGA
jgi:hypothetical protein